MLCTPRNSTLKTTLSRVLLQLLPLYWLRSLCWSQTKSLNLRMTSLLLPCRLFLATTL